MSSFSGKNYLPNPELMAACRASMAAELARRRAASDQGASAVDPRRTWALSFAGRPVDFIGAVMGQEWWGADWAAWRTFVRAVFGAAIPEDEMAIYREWTGRSEPSTRRQRESWCAIGRRGGKSRVLAMIGVYLACCEDWTARLAPGEVGFVRVLANNVSNASAIMGYAKAAFRHSRLAPLVVKDLTKSVELLGSTAVEVGTASIGAVRSRTIIAGLCDEIAFWEASEESANPDSEIMNALRPAMLTMPGAMVLGASSPYARKGVLWDAYRKWYGKDGEPLVWRAPTWVMHPNVDREEIDRAYREDPVAAGAEYGAEFRSDVLGFISAEAFDAVTIPGRFEVPPMTGRQYRAFVDPSGGAVDSMTLAIAHADARGIGVLDLLREVRPPFSPDVVAGEFAADCHRYGVAEVVGDCYGGEWPQERFRVRGVSYVESDLTKSDIYQAWLPLINARRLELLDDRRLIAQALNLERKVTRAGRDSIDHPPGGHDDVVNAAAGALVLACGERYPDVWAAADMAEVRIGAL